MSCMRFSFLFFLRVSAVKSNHRPLLHHERDGMLKVLARAVHHLRDRDLSDPICEWMPTRAKSASAIARRPSIVASDASTGTAS